MHINFATNSKLYPYDTQLPSIKLQSLDYGGDLISLTVKESFSQGSPFMSHKSVLQLYEKGNNNQFKTEKEPKLPQQSRS